MLTTCECDEKSVYRITIFNTGEMSLNVVGTIVKLFKINYNIDIDTNIINLKASLILPKPICANY